MYRPATQTENVYVRCDHSSAGPWGTAQEQGHRPAAQERAEHAAHAQWAGGAQACAAGSGIADETDVAGAPALALASSLL